MSFTCQYSRLSQVARKFYVSSSRSLSFHSHVSKLSKVLIKGGDWHVPSHGGGGDQTVNKVSLRSLIAIQSVEVDCYLTDLDAGTRDQASECGGDIDAWMPVKRLDHKHTPCQNDRQHHNHHVAPIAGIEQPPSCSGVLVMVLHHSWRAASAAMRSEIQAAPQGEARVYA
jgi:hypothetical protein